MIILGETSLDCVAKFMYLRLGVMQTLMLPHRGGFFPVRPLADISGLDWKAQNRKLSSYNKELIKFEGLTRQATPCLNLTDLENWLNSIDARRVKDNEVLLQMQDRLIDELRGSDTKELILPDEPQESIVERAVQAVHIDKPMSIEDYLIEDLVAIGIDRPEWLDYYGKTVVNFSLMDYDCNEVVKISKSWYISGTLQAHKVAGLLPETLAYLRNPKAWEDARVTKMKSKVVGEAVSHSEQLSGRRGQPWLSQEFAAEVSDRLVRNQKRSESEQYQRIKEQAASKFEIDFLGGI